MAPTVRPLRREQKRVIDERVSISARLRRNHPWFETLMQKTKDSEVRRRRKLERTKGPELSPQEVRAIADELEEVQQQINPLENKRKELSARLLVHWAHTGVEEVEHTLGKTLISTSFEMALDPVALKRVVGDPVWIRVTERMVQAAKLMGEGKHSALVRDGIEKAGLVRKLRISVTPPSSRRPKSAANEDESEEE